VRQIHPEALSIFRDAYNVEFLGLPQTHAEADLHRGLLDKLKDFLIELGRDFCFVASEYPLQVGGRDFALDLLFFHRGLNCLVAIELKVGRFEPEYLGKLAFYLEALDRDVRKAHEQPSIGVLLCASKNDEVVEYVLSRSLSPALIAEYQTQLPTRSCFRPNSTSSTFRMLLKTTCHRQSENSWRGKDPDLSRDFSERRGQEQAPLRFSLACLGFSFLFRGVQRGYFSFQREPSEIMKTDGLLISAEELPWRNPISACRSRLNE
jgi:hypothetical protein